MKIGLIGCGNMGGAIIGGILGQGIAAPEDIIASAILPEERESASARFGIETTADNRAVAGAADVLILAIKPNVMETVISEIRADVPEQTVIVTLAAGKTIAWLNEQFGRPVKLIRTMPNTPALVGAGMAALCPNEHVTDDDLARVLAIFRSFGDAKVMPEKDLDAATAISGSSPAYVYMFIEAMADAAVAEGMQRSDAYRFAAQAVLGSAKMVLETGKHPGELKDMVCSPGGTTIEAVRVLEDMGLRAAVIEAVRACAEKSRDL